MSGLLLVEQNLRVVTSGSEAVKVAGEIDQETASAARLADVPAQHHYLGLSLRGEADER